MDNESDMVIVEHDSQLTQRQIPTSTLNNDPEQEMEESEIHHLMPGRSPMIENIPERNYNTSFLKERSISGLFFFQNAFLLLVLFSSSASNFSGNWIIQPSDMSSIRLVFVLSILFSVGLSILWINLVVKLTNSMAKMTVALSTCLFLLLSIILLFSRPTHYFLGFCSLILAITNLLWTIRTKDQTQFVAVMLELVVGMLQKHSILFRFTAILLVLQIIWMIVWCLAVVNVMKINNPVILVAFLFFSLYWTSQVFKNMVVVASASTYAVWYFDEGSAVSPMSSLSMAKRACIDLFPAITVGSLFVGIAETIFGILQWSKRTKIVILIKVSYILLGWVENAIIFFNKYGFINVAAKGQAFLEASQSTWRLFEAQRLDAVVRHTLIQRVLLLGSYIGGSFIALIAAFSSYLAGVHSWAYVTFIAFCIGFCFLSTTVALLESAISTLFVGFAEQPETLFKIHHLVYHRLVRILELKQFDVYQQHDFV